MANSRRGSSWTHAWRSLVEFKDGREVSAQTSDWLGFFKRPMPPEEVRYKLKDLTARLAQAHPA